MNHDNGRVNTKTSSYHDEQGIKVWASKDIDIGEEIYATYDKCTDCYDIALMWGTGEILKDFGFVEGYPHRYVYEDEDLWFEVNKDENKNEFSIEWDSSGEYGIITGDGIEFLEEELKRIEEVGNRLLQENVDNVPDHEWKTIQAYYAALTTDLNFAIKASQKIVLGGDEL